MGPNGKWTFFLQLLRLRFAQDMVSVADALTIIYSVIFTPITLNRVQAFKLHDQTLMGKSFAHSDKFPANARMLHGCYNIQYTEQTTHSRQIYVFNSINRMRFQLVAAAVETTTSLTISVRCCECKCVHTRSTIFAVLMRFTDRFVVVVVAVAVGNPTLTLVATNRAVVLRLSARWGRLCSARM